MKTIALLLAFAASSLAASVGHFDFAYEIPNSHSHVQMADGDAIKGHYSVVDGDGKTRTIRYTADAKSGFVVHEDEEHHKEEHHEEEHHEEEHHEEDHHDEEHHDEGSDDGSYHETTTVHHEEGGDDGSYHSEHTHLEGVEEGKYRAVRDSHGDDGQDHGQYNHLRVVPVPLRPRYVLPHAVPQAALPLHPYNYNYGFNYGFGFPHGYPYAYNSYPFNYHL